MAGAYILPMIFLALYTSSIGGKLSVFNTLNIHIFTFTFYQAMLSTVMAIAIGLPGAYLLGKTKFKFKGIFTALSTVPFVMPSISMTLGFITFFGHSGILNSYFLWPIFHVRFEPLFTLLGVVMGNAFYNFPLTMIIVGAAFSMLDPVYSEAARIDGASRFKSFVFVELPILLPSIAAAALLTFIYCFMSFTVVLVIGGAQFSTVEVQIYMYLTTLLDFRGALGLTMIQLLFIAFFASLFTFIRRSAGTFSQEISESYSKFPVWGTFYILLISILIFGPILSQVFSGFWNFQNSTFTFEWFRKLFSGEMNAYIGNSVLFAIVWTIIFSTATAILTVVLSITSAHIIQKLKLPIFDALFTSSLAISPVTLAFGYIVLQNYIPLSFPLEIIPIYTVLSFPIGLQTLLSGWERFPKEIDEAASMDGANWLQKTLKVRIPILRPQIISTFFFAFAISMGEMGATLVLYNPEFPTISVSAYKLFSSMHVPEAQALGSILTISTFLVFYALERPILKDN
jgi:thiamine transport system permease protein